MSLLLGGKKRKEKKKLKMQKKAALEAAAAQLAMQSYEPTDARSPMMYQQPNSAMGSFTTDGQVEDYFEESGSDDFTVGDVTAESIGPDESEDVTPLPQRKLHRSQTNPEYVMARRLSQPNVLPRIAAETDSIQSMPVNSVPAPTVVPPAQVHVRSPAPPLVQAPVPVPVHQSPPPQQPVVVAQSTVAAQEHNVKKPAPVYVTAKENGTIKRTPTIHTHYPAVKIPPQKAELIKHVVELGLGRGIDATSRTPWMSKSIFQVRKVQPSVVETKELGTVASYDHAIQNIQQMEHQFQASLNPPETPVTICVEDESNRTLNTTRRVIGKRVINSTVGFQTDFEEKCSDGDSPKFARESFLVPRDPTEVVFNTQNSSLTFEERVSLWILHRIAHRFALAGQKCDFFRSDGGSPMDRLAKLIQSKAISKTDEYVKAGCKELIQGLRITHYVSSMKLGALEYRVISEGEYHKQLAKGGAFGLDAAVDFCAKASKRQAKRESRKYSQLRKLGNINKDGRVEQRSSDETVISVEVQPIARLFRLPSLKLAIQDAVDEYMDNTLGQEGGPFVIMCAGRNIYLTVNKFSQHQVEGTENPSEASLFYFVPTDDGGNPFDFHIAYYEEDVETAVEHSQTDVARYLEAPINAKGECTSPLYMKHSVKVRKSRFTLRSRLSKKYSNSHLSEWVSGEDAFYIACASNKMLQHGSYVGIKRTESTDIMSKHFFTTACFSNIHQHNGANTFLLFQLVPNCKEALSNLQMEGNSTPGKLPPPEQPVKKSSSQQALVQL